MKWIKVDNKLPESEGNYLTYWSDGVMETFGFEDNIVNDPQWYGVPLANSIITHWMPLPEPPEE